MIPYSEINYLILISDRILRTSLRWQVVCFGTWNSSKIHNARDELLFFTLCKKHIYRLEKLYTTALQASVQHSDSPYNYVHAEFFVELV